MLSFATLQDYRMLAANKRNRGLNGSPLAAQLIATCPPTPELKR
jgi:hypothetical protein